MDIRIATRQLRSRAVELEREIYRSDHGHAPQIEPEATYFAAQTGTGEVVASFRILGSNHRPFEFEQYLQPGCLTIREPVGLIGRLCVRHDYRSVSKQASLMRELMAKAFSHFLETGLNSVVMFTFPRLRLFYERALFQSTGITFFHPGYNQQMEIMVLDVQLVRKLLCDRDPRAVALFGSVTVCS